MATISTASIGWDEWPAYAPDEILPRLFQGGTEDHHVLGEPAPHGHYAGPVEFDVVITLYADAMPAAWGVEEIRFGFPDSALRGPDLDRIMRLARTAHERWVAGDRVLIRCQAGVNRSGLVTALVLMQAGFNAQDAIELIRARRARICLANRDFERWLIEQAPAMIVQGVSA